MLWHQTCPHHDIDPAEHFGSGSTSKGESASATNRTAPESTGKRCPVPPFFFRWWESAFPKRTSIRRSTRMIAMSTVMWSWMRPQPTKFGSWRISWVVWCRRKSGVLQGWTNKPADGSIMMPGVADVFSVFPVISTRNRVNLLLLFCLF